VAGRDDVGDAAQRDPDARLGAGAGRALVVPVADLQVDEGDVAGSLCLDAVLVRALRARSAVDVARDVDVVRVELHAQGVVDPALRAPVALDVEDEVDGVRAVALATFAQVDDGPRGLDERRELGSHLERERPADLLRDLLERLCAPPLVVGDDQLGARRAAARVRVAAWPGRAAQIVRAARLGVRGIRLLALERAVGLAGPVVLQVDERPGDEAGGECGEDDEGCECLLHGVR
jgi:hypothetical protein